MVKEYLARISGKDLVHCADMLRYDNCYEARKVGEDMFEIRLLQFTPARWLSFGVKPADLSFVTLTLTQKEWNDKLGRARGFSDGIKFVQRIYPDIETHTGIYLVQDN